jgi:hypothetical protein
MSVPTFEEIKQALLIPEFEVDKWGRRVYDQTDNLPRAVSKPLAGVRFRLHSKGKWDG